MCERPGREGEWVDPDQMTTTPGKRLSPEMAERLARARETPVEVDDGSGMWRVPPIDDDEATQPEAVPFDLSDVRRG
jgi:hypothetical protein